MKKNTNTVQMVVLAIFGIGIAVGVLFFSGKVPLPGDNKSETGLIGQVTVWGVLPYNKAKPLFDSLQIKNKGLKLTYVEKKPETIQAELVNALSSGKGPDVFMMPPGGVAQNLDRLYIVPFASYAETTYRNTFADISSELVTPSGILAFPVFIDPMIMYYNRDLLTSAFLPEAPTTWDQVAEIVPSLTRKDDSGKISQAAIALGTTNNISYPKDLVVLKMLQAGNPLVSFLDGKWFSVIDSGGALSGSLSWFINHSISTQPVYSWNQSLPKDRDFFTAGSLAMYFGYPTEVEAIRKKNPNLNFGIAMIPQTGGNVKKVNYGRMYTIGISKLSKNLPGALGVANLITSKENMMTLLEGTYYAPARKDLLADKPRDNAERVLIYNSAIISKSFMDPDVQESSRLITTAINQINAGAKSVGASILSIASGFRDLTSKMSLPEAPLK